MKAFGGSWTEAASVALTTLAIYVTVVAGLRVAGRRTVSQMSAFDFVVTIAIGSLVAATALAPDASYLRGAASLATLLAAQQVVAVIRQRVPAARRFLDFTPQPLYRGDDIELRHNPLTAQVTEAELWGKLRHHGIGSLEEVKLIVLEADGRISVLRSDASTDIWQDQLR